MKARWEEEEQSAAAHHLDYFSRARHNLNYHNMPIIPPHPRKHTHTHGAWDAMLWWWRKSQCMKKGPLFGARLGREEKMVTRERKRERKSELFALIGRLLHAISISSSALCHYQHLSPADVIISSSNISSLPPNQNLNEIPNEEWFGGNLAVTLAVPW